MAAVTLEINPDLESRLRREAAREGLDPQGYILNTLRQRLTGVRRPAVPRLAAYEAKLLREINQGLPAKTWRHYRVLREKRREENLTAEEQAELIVLSDRIEELNVRRMECIIQLARARQTPVDALVDDLGIKSPPYG